jgi:hypothetical protein
MRGRIEYLSLNVETGSGTRHGFSLPFSNSKRSRNQYEICDRLLFLRHDNDYQDSCISLMMDLVLAKGYLAKKGSHCTMSDAEVE